MQNAILWQVLAFAVVVVGLSILAPLAWYAEHSHSSDKRSLARRHRSTAARESKIAVHELPPPRPQLAPIGPLVADQISLDPSIQETPAIPTGRPDLSDLLPGESEVESELRLSAISRPVQPIIPPASEMRAARESSELPGTSPFPIPEQSLPEQPLPTRCWPEAKSLIEQVHGAAQAMPTAARWSEQVTSSLSHLAGLPSLADPAVSGELSNLRSLADEAKVLAQSASDDQARSKILCAGYAIVRRLVIWDMVHGLASSGNLSAAPIVDHHGWTAALHEVDAMLQATGAAANWRKYLLIDCALMDFDSHNCSPADQRQLACDMLYRLHSTQLSREQEKFLRTPPFEALDEQLERGAVQTPDLAALLRAIERHESEHSVPAARSLAVEFDMIRWSGDAEVRELAEAVNAYYRNANVRRGAFQCIGEPDDSAAEPAGRSGGGQHRWRVDQRTKSNEHQSSRHAGSRQAKVEHVARSRRAGRDRYIVLQRPGDVFPARLVVLQSPQEDHDGLPRHSRVFGRGRCQCQQ